ncbi:MAG: 3-hydroxyacyl-ACP dehydratase FabZ [Gammaproteobacteria bacterium]
MTDAYCLTVEDIKERLPHRYPFLFIDGIKRCEPGKSIVAVKNVSADEPQFVGHFPGFPIMPGVLIIEAMAQAGGVLIWETIAPEERNFILYLVGIEKSRFRRPAHPGDQILLTVDLIASRSNLWRFDAKAEINGDLVVSAELLQARGLTL